MAKRKNEPKTTQLKNIPYGEYFKTVNSKGVVSKTVYKRKEYDRSLKKYEADNVNDISATRTFKGSQKVTTDFIY